MPLRMMMWKLNPGVVFVVVVVGGVAAGARVLSGHLKQQADLWRVIRNGAVVWEGPCSSLRHHKQAVDEVANGSECGVVLGDGAFSAFEVGDRLVCLVQSRRPAFSAAKPLQRPPPGGVSVGRARQQAAEGN